MPGGDEPGEREELVKRNTRQLYLMFFVFAIIIAAYSCRLLAWFDIGGNYPSYVRAALYLLLFVLWGVFSGSADYSETGAALSSLDGCSDAYLVDFAYFEI